MTLASGDRVHSDSSSARDTEDWSPRRRSAALAVLLLCVFTASVDVTIVNVALPSMGVAFRAGTSTLQWVVDAYNIVLAGLLLLGAGIADRLGRKRVYLTGYAVFGVGCLVAAFASSTQSLIAARAVTGVGAALVLAPSLAILGTIYPPEQRSRAIALWAMVGGAGIAVGPVVGGVLLSEFWWGSVFLVNVPVVMIGVVLGARLLPESRRPDNGRLDPLGAVLSVAGLGVALFGVIEGPSRGWSAPVVLISLIGGSAVLGAFGWWESRSTHPMFDVSVLSRRAVRLGAAVLVLTYICFTSMLFLVPQYLQSVEGHSVIEVGLLLVPFAVAFAVTSSQVPRSMERVGEPRLLMIGSAQLAVAVGLLAVASQLGGTPAVLIATALMGVGIGLLITPASTVTMNDLPAERAGEGSATNMVSRYVGAALGVALTGTVFASVYSHHVANRLESASSRTVEEARTGIHAALVRSDQLGGAAGDEVARAARASFEAGMTAAFATLCVLCAIGAVAVRFAASTAAQPRGPHDNG